MFLRQKLAGRPFTVVGDGTQTRDFTYVGDVARAFWLAAERARGGAANENFNGMRTFVEKREPDLLS